MEGGINHGFWPLIAADAHSLRHRAYQKRHARRLRFPALAAVLMLTASMVMLPAERALADGQVLELPQTTTASAPPSTPYAAPAPAAYPADEAAPEPAPEPAEVADATPPPGVGDINDYMHQDGQPAQSHGQTGYAQPYPGSHPDPHSNPPSLATTAIVGAIAVGLIALDVYASHHHR
jgi:hypothetical protein